MSYRVRKICSQLKREFAWLSRDTSSLRKLVKYKIERFVKTTHPISSIFGLQRIPCFRLFVLPSVDRAIRACSSFAIHESTVGDTDGLGDEHLS
jgi:hypothetical protein